MAQDNSILQKIIDSCKYVMNSSKHVIINYDKLNLFIKNIDSDKIKHWLTNNPYNLLELGIENVVNFLLYFEAINYSFWGEPKWTVETELRIKDGSDALLYLLLKYVKEQKKMDFSKVSLNEFKKLLKGNVEIPLINERYKTLVEISEIVNRDMNGNFYKYISHITKDTDLFELIVNSFPSFKDEREYNGKKIYFYKLAQLLVSDILHLREVLEEIKVDYSHLLGCADYKIPQTLRALDIISYDNELSSIVDNKIEIEYSSKYEVEIRASMLVVIDYIKNKLTDNTAIDINDYFFTVLKNVKDKSKPYHLCRNTNY